MEAQSKNTTKEPLSDEQIIELYWSRDEMAITETDFKYKKYLSVIIYNILNDNLDCEECLNDTYLGAWNAIPPTRPNVLKAFLMTIARRAAIKRYHSKNRKRAVPSEMTVSLSEIEAFVAGDDDVAEGFDAERLGRVISDFLRSLPTRKQFIFMSRYYSANSIDVIARELNLSRSMINKELASIREDLRIALEKEGYDV